MRGRRPLVLAAAGLVALISFPAYSQSEKSGQPAAGDAEKMIALIDQYPQGGEQLIGAIARAVAEHPDLASSVTSVRNAESPEVEGARAAGLARGAVMLAATDPATSRRICEAVSRDGDGKFAAQFSVAYSLAREDAGAGRVSSAVRGGSGPERPIGVDHRNGPDADRGDEFRRNSRVNFYRPEGPNADRGNPFQHNHPVSPN